MSSIGRRLPTETVAQFLARLPPSKGVAASYSGMVPPWYWIHSPTRTAAPCNVEAFTREGRALLDEFQSNVAQCRPRDELKAQLRSVLEQQLKDAAKKHGVTVGKWMLFPPLAQVDNAWAKVCHAVDADRLGITAKVATASDDGYFSTRLICIYTADFTDIQDVKRVLREMVKLGLVKTDTPKGVSYYKCDAWTHLGIYAKNEYGLKPSVYSSQELLSDEDEDVEMTGV